MLRPGRPVLLLLGAAVLLAGCGGASHQAFASHQLSSTQQTSPSGGGKDGLVGYPAFLPKSTLNYHSDALVVGTEVSPALTNQGDPVKVETPHWSVVADVTGPEVPGEGLPYQANFTTCTWLVTLSSSTGPVPISVSDFDTMDYRGDVYRPYLVPGQPAVPRILEPGHQLSFELRAGEPVGEGIFRWAPIGGHVVAKWDFVIEND